MGWLRRTLDSSVGGKYVVSITGLALVVFVLVHLSGNLLVFAGPDAMRAYASGLRRFPALLWVVRIGLLIAAILHIYYAIKLNLENKAARPVTYTTRHFRKASFSSRHMVLTGLLLLVYVLYHLAHFTFRVTSDEIAKLELFDVYEMLLLGFQNPLVSLTYIISMVVLGLHLSHGISSMTQSLGINHPKYNPLLRRIGPVAAVLIAGAYISIPVAVLLGFVG